jgi:PPOX class probable F420-dependent enzyme
MLNDEQLTLLSDDVKAFGHVATIGPDGEPQSSPVWISTDGEHLQFSLTTDRQKYRNLQGDPRVAVSLTDPDNPYEYLEVRGTATIEPDPDNDFIDAMARKYTEHDSYPWHQPGDERVVVNVTIEHTTGMSG